MSCENNAEQGASTNECLFNNNPTSLKFKQFKKKTIDKIRQITFVVKQIIKTVLI